MHVLGRGEGIKKKKRKSDPDSKVTKWLKGNNKICK